MARQSVESFKHGNSLERSLSLKNEMCKAGSREISEEAVAVI